MEIQFSSFAGVYYRKTQIYMKKAFKQLDISFEEGIVLLNVFANPDTSQDRIANAIVLDAAAVARSLKSLEQKGYLTRVIDMENQRRKLTHITPAGIELVERINLAMRAWDDEIFKGLDNNKRMTLAESVFFLQHQAAQIDISTLIDNCSF